MLDKFMHCTGNVLANTRPHHLHWGDQEMETAISCKKDKQVAGTIDMVGKSICLVVFVCAAVK